MSGEKFFIFIEIVNDNCLYWRILVSIVYLIVIEVVSINGDYYVMCDVMVLVIVCWLVDWFVFIFCFIIIFI